MAKFCSLFSSSRGNCTYIGTRDGGILIDCGVSCKKTTQTLSALGVEPQRIHAIFITHEHTDHVSGLRVFAGKWGIPVFTSRGTLAALENMQVLNGKFSVDIIPSSGLSIGDFHVRPFPLSHDARDPVGYSVTTSDGRRISVATDTGVVTDAILSAVNGSDLVLLESNHDIGMLQNGTYPYATKRRILSAIGHLSNDACAEAAVSLLESGTTRFCLGHLSPENNIPALAYQTTYSELTMAGAKEGSDYQLTIAGGVPEMIYI